MVIDRQHKVKHFQFKFKNCYHCHWLSFGPLSMYYSSDHFKTCAIHLHNQKVQEIFKMIHYINPIK